MCFSQNILDTQDVNEEDEIVDNSEAIKSLGILALLIEKLTFMFYQIMIQPECLVTKLVTLCPSDIIYLKPRKIPIFYPFFSKLCIGISKSVKVSRK